jgi:ribosomal subunit interface protein
MTQIPIQVNFRNMDRSPGMEQHIHEKVAVIEHLHPRIVACRVTIEPNSHRHGRAGAFHVGIDVTVPGAELVVTHEPAQHEELTTTLDEAFVKIRRRLDEYAQRHRATAGG